jgi:hypothetical protein
MTSRARIPTIEWQVAGACNYDCSYCIQSRRYRRGRPSGQELASALAGLAELPGIWEIKCSGGEAFAHPLFLERVVPGLMNGSQHRISVLTNFSASNRDLMKFARLTRGRLSVFSASLHLERVDAEEFADKAEWFCSQLDPEVNFVVNQVVLPGREAEAAACREIFVARDIRWFAQLYKVDGRVAEYAPAALDGLLGSSYRDDPRVANTAPSYRGLQCWAGVEYFVADKDGACWSCRTAKRHGEGALGNLFKGAISRYQGPSPCPYDICPCTVPANRGMIEGAG